MNGRTPTKDEKAWMQAIADHGCIVCMNEGKFTPTAIHHINGSKKKDCHFETIPLCYYHHQGGNDDEAYTSRHPFKTRFAIRYGTDAELLQQMRSILGKFAEDEL